MGGVWRAEANDGKAFHMGKAENIVSWLKAEIASGGIPAGGRIPSEYELAERFGVNKTTANKAVGTMVVEGLLERGCRGAGTRVRAAAPYRASIMFVIVAEHPSYAKMANGAQRAALARGYLTILAGPPPSGLGEFIAQMSPEVVKGILTSTYGPLQEPPGVPVIHLDREFTSGAPPRHIVNADNAAGAGLAVEEFLRQGHRDIVMLNYHATPSRAEGFIRTLQAAGAASASERVFNCCSADAISALTVKEMMARFPGLTGIVTASDDIAFRLAKILPAMGIDMPGRVSISGFGNVRNICDLLELTSVDQHCFEMGAFAANRLIDMVEGKCGQEPFNELLPCELVRRQSVLSLASAAGRRASSSTDHGKSPMAATRGAPFPPRRFAQKA